jgi:hypothetical protein
MTRALANMSRTTLLGALLAGLIGWALVLAALWYAAQFLIWVTS